MRLVRTLVPVQYRPVLREMYGTTVLAPLLSGGRVQCICCGWLGRRFLRTDDPTNPMCPRCRSVARHRLLAYYLFRECNFQYERLRVLHIAPERCLARRFATLENLEYLTGDLAHPSVDIQFDLVSIPFPDNTFDVVFCLHVLEHVTDDVKALGEILRILRPGGWAILQPALNPAFEETHEDPTVADPEERLLRFESAGHVRIYGRDFAARLRAAGFDVSSRAVSAWLSRTAIQRFGLDPTEIFHVCTKPIDAAE